LDSALRKLGFRLVAPRDAPIGYQHDASGTIVLLRSHREDDFVPPGTLGATQKLLIDRGLVDQEHWSALLQTTAA
jgi:hypothetical protein